MTDRANHDDGQAADGKVGALGIAMRGMFLACSWTWCIGMFFPVFFVGDFGLWGWVAFAVPNVLGAGAMGWVLRKPHAADRLLHDHVTAARWFSIVTILFQLSFGSWFFEIVLSRFVPWHNVSGPLCAGLMLVSGAALASLGSAIWHRLAAIVWSLSVLMGVAAWFTGSTLGIVGTPPRQDTWELALTVPALVFGFGLCPYLDLTFLRVRRETHERAGEIAFWIGFIVFFTPMILLTLLYARGLIDSKDISLYIVGHIFTQATFTIGAHLRELFAHGVIRTHDTFALLSPSRTAIHTAAACSLVLLAMLSVLLAQAPELRPGYSARRLVYELFMSFYALVFPAYVWIVVIERGLPRGTRLTLYVIALVLASPCLWLGYIEQHYIWLLPGVAIPLLLPFIARALMARPTAR